MSDVGYIRVSSYSQNTERQLATVHLDEVFTEKATAKDTDRPQLNACLKYLRKGDTLHVHSIDRLARNLLDLQQRVEQLTLKGVRVHFHKEALIFSGEDNAMAKLLMQVMGAIAEFERTLINERRREGIEQAKRQGKQIGRKRALSEAQEVEVYTRNQAGETQAELAKVYGVARDTIRLAINRQRALRPQ